MTKRILVDMSATLIHHGHVRLLSRASEYGDVIVALTTDDEILLRKGYTPELKYEYRREILEAITFVKEVIPAHWLITEEFLNQHKIDFLVHGDDHQNPIDKKKLIIFPRTAGISSSELRQRTVSIVNTLNNKKG